MGLLVCSLVSAILVVGSKAIEVQSLEKVDQFIPIGPTVEEIPTEEGGDIVIVKRYETEDGFKVFWHEWNEEDAMKGYAPTIFRYEEAGEKRELSITLEHWIEDGDGVPRIMQSVFGKKVCNLIEVPPSQMYPAK